MRRKELFYYVSSGSNVMRDVHWCVFADYQQIANGNTAIQINGFAIDYGEFILKPNYLVILPPTQRHSFFRNLPPL